MDGNGNNNSKVSTLRQRFENYEKIDRRPSAPVIPSILFPLSNSPSAPAVVQLTSKPTERGSPSKQSTKSAFADVDGSFLQENLLMSAAPEVNKRNGIYSPCFSGKRRGMVLVDGTNPPSQPEIPYEEMLLLDDELDDPTIETSLGFEPHHDGLSIASNSTTSSHHSFHTGFPKSKTDASKLALVNTGSVGGPRESGSTPTSSSSCSSTGACGKVKRRNAFRHKDVSSFPTSTAAGDGTSSAVLAAVVKTKVERVKSLDSATNTLNKNSSKVAMSSMKTSKVSAGVNFESPKNEDKGSFINGASEGAHPLQTSNDFKGNPAQRAASLCVRNNSNINEISSSLKSSSLTSSSQLYEPVNSAFARNNQNNNHHLFYNYQLQQQLQSDLDNQAQNSSQRVVNVVTPYQVTDIYNQISESSLKKQQLKQQIAEYAVPMIQQKMEQKSEIPPKVPPPPLNYPPSSIKKEQFGLPSPNSSYTFLPHRKPAKSSPSNSIQKTPNAVAKSPRDTSKGSMPGATGGVSYAAPEKPPRTFLYNQSNYGQLASPSTSGQKDLKIRTNAASCSPTKSHHRAVMEASEPIYTRKKREDGGNSSTKLEKKVQLSSQGKSSNLHHHNHQHNHPPLVRSKTESQLVVKNKNGRFLNRPSDPALGYNQNFHQDLLATNPTTTLAQISSSLSSYYASSTPPPHHQSQTNLMGKIQEQQHYRSINNLLGYNQGGQGAGGGMQFSKYPSNPGLHYATRELPRLEHGLPPVNSSGSAYNLYDNHHQTRSLMYTNIDISPRDKTQYDRSPPTSGESPHSIYGMKPSDSVQQLRNNQPYPHQFRLPERSKSEWALNAVHLSASVGVPLASPRINPTLNSTIPPPHHPHRQKPSERGNNAVESSIPVHMMGRRATVAIASSPQMSNSGFAGSPGNVGHPSLDSSMSTPPHSNTSLSSMPPNNHQSAKGNRHHHHHHVHAGNVPPSIQHLVNQLFNTSTIKDATSSTDSGIQLGSESLSSCDTPIGDSTTDTGDSDCENEGDASNSARKVVEARKGYVRRVSSVRVQELGESLHRLIQSSKVNLDPLFECLLVVGLDRDPSNGIYHPYIREKFPRDAKLAEGVEQFCFPDSLEWPCHEGSTAQFYTLAITDQRGGRKFGCCFRILPEGANFCIPITYCIISSHRAIGFYREILKEITSCHGHSEYQRRHFLQELYKKSFPPPGSSISVTEPTLEETYVSNDPYGMTGSPTKTVTIRRRADHRLDEGDLVTLVSTVDLSIVIKLFGSLLLERKVVLLSRALSTLSLCVEALESLLYPFNWQHTFVPILPLDMTDVIEAPAPFLIGVLRSSRNAWDKTLDDGIVVDLDVDNGKVISCVGDEGTILPKRIHRKLRNALSQLVIDLADQKESTKNVLISECFIRMFVETLGHYANHIITKPDGTRVFEREAFIKSSESKATQNFLEWFSETSMFNEFIELKLKSPSQHGLFEQRVMEQIESGPIVNGTSSGGTPLKKDIWVKMKGPFGSWLKETFKQ